MNRVLTLLAAGLVLLSCGNRDAASTPGRIVVAYVTGWDNGVIPDVNYMTHINYAFGHVNESFDGIRIGNEARLRLVAGLKTEKPELKVLLSIGGWGSGRFSEMAATARNRAAFAKDCLRVIEEYGLDGVDLDWEYPTSRAAGISASPEDTGNFTLLMKEIRSVIGPERLLTYASVWNAHFIDHKAVLPYVDFVNIMSYDMNAAGSAISSGLHASALTGRGGTTESALQAHLDAGIPKDKLTVGLPFYGRGKEKEYADYVDFRAIDSTRFEVRWDEEAMVPYLVNEAGEFIFNYENARSMRLKCDFIATSGVLGAMYWDYGADNDESTLRRIVAAAMLGYEE